MNFAPVKYTKCWFSHLDLMGFGTLVEQITRLFFQRLLYNKIPVRGAITYGDFYSEKAKNVFVGPALVDSYKHGEDQKWVGLILTPLAVNKLEQLSALEVYRMYQPIPDGIMRDKAPDKIKAYNFERGNLSLEHNSFIECLEEMKEKAPLSIQHKYQLAIDFAMSEHRRYYDRN